MTNGLALGRVSGSGLPDDLLSLPSVPPGEVAVAPDRLFVVPFWDYRIFEIDSDGRVRRILDRSPSWFEGLNPNDGSLQSFVLSAYWSDDLLWVLSAVPSDPSRLAFVLSSVEDFEDLNRFYLEAIDVVAEAVVYSAAFERPPYHRDLDGIGLYRFVEGRATGLMSFELLGPSLSSLVPRR